MPMPHSVQSAGLLSKFDWKPTKAHGCTLWYSSTSVATSGGLVDALNDSSPSAFNAAQTGISRAAYVAGPPTSVVFDGANDYYLNDGILATNKVTFGLIYKLNSFPTGSNFQYIFKLRQGVNSMFDLFTVGPSLTGPSGYWPTCFSCKVPAAGHPLVGIAYLNGTDFHTLLVGYNGLDPTLGANYRFSLDYGGMSIPSQGGSSSVAFGSSGVVGTIGAYYNAGAMYVPASLVLKELVVFDRDLFNDDFSEYLNLRAWLNSPKRMAT